MTINGTGSASNKRLSHRGSDMQSLDHLKGNSKEKSENLATTFKNEAQSGMSFGTNGKKTSRLKMLETLRQSQKQFETENKL